MKTKFELDNAAKNWWILALALSAMLIYSYVLNGRTLLLEYGYTVAFESVVISLSVVFGLLCQFKLKNYRT